jgi:hypothetical protein
VGNPLYDPANIANFIISLDGVHCPVEEPKHASFQRDETMYSHKINAAAVDYELALALHECRIVSIVGPVPASFNDLTIFRQGGLKMKLPPNTKGIADNGYAGDEKLSTPNPLDPQELYEFKKRARMRQETLNKRIKDFKCMSTTFRHPLEKHQICFMVICLILQYQFDHGDELFEI